MSYSEMVYTTQNALQVQIFIKILDTKYFKECGKPEILYKKEMAFFIFHHDLFHILSNACISIPQLLQNVQRLSKFL